MQAPLALRTRAWYIPADSALKAAGDWGFVLALPLTQCVTLGLSFPTCQLGGRAAPAWWSHICLGALRDSGQVLTHVLFHVLGLHAQPASVEIIHCFQKNVKTIVLLITRAPSH